MSQLSKTAAQERADQINAFQRELALLAQDQVLTLEPEQQHSIDDYHQNLLSQYQHAFDIDRSQQEKIYSDPIYFLEEGQSAMLYANALN